MSTACFSKNDLSGVSAQGLAFDGSYDVFGTGITLGSSGLTANVSSSLSLPITLGAPQTWTVGRNALVGVGKVTGSTEPLTIDVAPDRINGNISNFSLFIAGGDIEVGRVTVTSGEVGLVGGLGSNNPDSLNATDGNPVNFIGDSGLDVNGNGSVGPLTMSGTSNFLGLNGVLAVRGGATFATTSTVSPLITHAGTTPGTDFGQISATGNVALGGASLVLDGVTGPGPNSPCPTLHVSDMDTLVTTTGSLTGTFNGVPDGTVVSLTNCSGTPPTVRINYTARTVTATVVTTGSSTGTGRYALTVNKSGSGSGTVTSGDGGINCGSTCLHSYAGGTMVTLTATPASGSTFAGFTGGGCSGTGTCTVTTRSAQFVTATFNATASGGGGGGTGGDGGGGGTSLGTSGTGSGSSGTSGGKSGTSGASGGTGSGSGTPGGTGGTVGTVGGSGNGVVESLVHRIKVALRNALATSGKGLTLAELLKHGGYTFSFSSPSSGQLVILWELSQGSAKSVHGKPQVIATANQKIRGSGRKRIKLRLTRFGQALLRKAHQVKIIEKATFHPAGGPSITVTKTLSIRR